MPSLLRRAMANYSCCRVLASAPFKFLVGHDKTLFTMHTALVTHHSKPLGSLVNGPMSEAKEGYAWLEDVDEHTMVRFGQYAYAGNYATAEPDILIDAFNVLPEKSASRDGLPKEVERDEDVPRASSAVEPQLTDAEPIEERKPRQTKHSSKRRGKETFNPYDGGEELFEATEPITTVVRSKKSILWDKFKNEFYSDVRAAFEPRKNRKAYEDYTEVFLCHARLYVFADIYDVEPLKGLCLQKLQRTLVEFTLYEERLEDIVELLRYSYLNTADHSGSIDALRLLVIRYAACVVEKLARSNEFRSLLEDSGPLARDLVETMLQRME